MEEHTGETNPILSKFVDIGSLDLSSVASNIWEAQVVCKNNKKIGPFRSHAWIIQLRHFLMYSAIRTWR